MLDEHGLDRRAPDADAVQLEPHAEPHAAPGGMLQTQGQNVFDDLGWCSLRMGHVDRLQILKPLQALQFKAPLVVVELGAGHAALAACCTHMAQQLRQLQHALLVSGDFLVRLQAYDFALLSYPSD